MRKYLTHEGLWDVLNQFENKVLLTQTNYNADDPKTLLRAINAAQELNSFLCLREERYAEMLRAEEVLSDD